MIRLQDGRRVQWTHLGKHYVGKVQTLIDAEQFIQGSDSCPHGIARCCLACRWVQVKSEPDGAPYAISLERLSPYPADPIPEPTNTGRTD